MNNFIEEDEKLLVTATAAKRRGGEREIEVGGVQSSTYNMGLCTWVCSDIITMCQNHEKRVTDSLRKTNGEKVATF